MREMIIEEEIPYAPMGVRGFFEWELKDYKSGKVVQKGITKNVVVNSGKNIIVQRIAGTAEAAVGWMDMGTDATAAVDTQTGLISRSGTTKACGTAYTSATTSTAGALAAMLFSAAYATDENNFVGGIKEIGLFNASATNARTMFARATVNINKDNTQTLTVNYTIQAQSSTT